MLARARRRYLVAVREIVARYPATSRCGLSAFEIRFVGKGGELTTDSVSAVAVARLLEFDGLALPVGEEVVEDLRAPSPIWLLH